MCSRTILSYKTDHNFYANIFLSGYSYIVELQNDRDLESWKILDTSQNIFVILFWDFERGEWIKIVNIFPRVIFVVDFDNDLRVDKNLGNRREKLDKSG